MSTTEQALDEPFDRTGPISLPLGLLKPGAQDVAAIPCPRHRQAPHTPVGQRHAMVPPGATSPGYATGATAVPDAALAAAANATAFAAIY